MIKISVIIPVYNAELYLKQCLDSLREQELQDIEIICVDDGSTDHSLEIITQYSVLDSRFKILNQKNQYAGVARNAGMKRATGKYLLFLDSDDFFERDFLAKMYDAAEANASDIVICRVNYYDEIEKTVIPRNVQEELIYLPEDTNNLNRRNMAKYLFQLSNGWPWDKLFRTDFIRELGIQYQGYRIANDGFFVYAALAQAKKITKINDFLVNQRINNGQSLSNTREKTWHCGFEMIYAIRDYLQQNNLYDLLKQSFLNFCIKYAVWSFNAMKSWSVKGDIYNAIQTELISELAMEKFQEDYFYDKDCYERFDYIRTHSYDDYISDLLEEKQNCINSLRQRLTAVTEKAGKKIWPVPYSKIVKDSSIVLYGAGAVGRDFYQQICDSAYCNVVLWMDKQFEKNVTDNAICGWTEEFSKCEYDKVLIAVSDENAVQEILEFLINQNVPKDKIICEW